MNCFCGQINMSMMINPYINPFLGMRMGVGMFSSVPANTGTPYYSMIKGNYTQTPISPNSIFVGGLIPASYMFGCLSPIPSFINIGAQIFNTGNRIGQTIHDNWDKITGLFRRNNVTPSPLSPGQNILSPIATPVSLPVPSLMELTKVKTTSVKPKHEATQSNNNGKCRPAAGKKLGKDFLNAVKGVAQRVNCDYRDLLAVMNGESGLNPQAVNPHGGATGLIQFMPKTAERLGTSTEAIKNMSAIEQLTYVEKFLVRCKKAAGFGANDKLSGGDLYALIFLPARAKREVLCKKGEGNKYYESNSATDLNKDGKITKNELQQRIEKKRVDESMFA